MTRPSILLLSLLTASIAHAGDPAAAANAAVPESYRDLLSFELKAHTQQYGSFDAVVPTGWRYDPDTQTYSPPVTLLPPHGKRLGFSSVRIWTTCAGTCTAKDWSAVIGKKASEYKDKGYLIERDETPSPNQRVVVSTHADKRIYAHFFSKPGASRYFLCEAEVDSFAQATQGAFEAACSSLIIRGWR